MLSPNKTSNNPFDDETLESLLCLEEGPALDFKKEQYRFNKASDAEKSEVLKDILAFANSHRFRTAYVLVGVEEMKGGRGRIIGVDDHLDDAILHQFVNFKTNRPVAFSYYPFMVEGKEIGILSIPIQTRPVYCLKRFGKLTANTVYARDGSSTRVASPDEIAAMGRDNPPRLVEWSIKRLRNISKNAIVTTAEQWQRHPRRHIEYGSRPRQVGYEEAREWVTEMVEKRYATLDGYPSGMDSYASLHWVFRRFEELAECCAQTIRTIGPALIESGALMRALVEMESSINFEKSAWEGFRLRMDGPGTPLPGETHYNMLSLAMRAVRFVEVLDDSDNYGDPDHEALNSTRQPLFQRSVNWGDWR